MCQNLDLIAFLPILQQYYISNFTRTLKRLQSLYYQVTTIFLISTHLNTCGVYTYCIDFNDNVDNHQIINIASNTK